MWIAAGSWWEEKACGGKASAALKTSGFDLWTAKGVFLSWKSRYQTLLVSEHRSGR